MSKKLYDTLGVNENATAKEIKDAFKEKAKENHPDRGGNEEKMKEYNHAYAVLINPDKRKRYDETGSDSPENSFEARFLGLVNTMFISIVDANPLEKVKTKDLIRELKTKINNTKKEIKNMLTGVDRKISIYEEALKRISTKGDSSIQKVLTNQIEQQKQHQVQMKQEIEFLDNCLVCAEDYTYSFDEEPQEEEVRFTTKQTGWFSGL